MLTALEELVKPLAGKKQVYDLMFYNRVSTCVDDLPNSYFMPAWRYLQKVIAECTDTHRKTGYEKILQILIMRKLEAFRDSDITIRDVDII